jgi:glycosyltransferase involved in cell wall biosynthesis
MRLLFLSTDPGIPVLGHKGASVHVRAVVSGLVAAGAEVVVASPRIGFEGELLGAKATLVEISPVLPKTFADVESLLDAADRQAEEVLSIAAELEVDAVYERLALYSAAGVRTAGALAIPHALEVNAPLTTEAARFRSLPPACVAVALERETLEHTDRVLAVSQQLAALLVEAGVSAAKVAVVPNGVDAEMIRRIVPSRGARFTLGFAGSLKPWHGVDVLLAAFALALEREPSLRLEVAGSGPLAALVEACDLPAAALYYHGQLTHDETLAAIAGWDVGVAPYPLLEDFYFSPLKVGEYMACGACPLTSDLPVLRALLGDGARGVLVEPGDANAFAAAIVALARDRLRAHALGERARAFALSSLDWQHNAQTALAALAPLTGAQR